MHNMLGGAEKVSETIKNFITVLASKKGFLEDVIF